MMDVAQEIVKNALARGASAVEATLSEGDEFTVVVRKGEIEQLKEAGSRGAGVRVLVGQRTGAAYTSDLTREGLDRMVASALDNARVTTEDPFAGLPEACGTLSGDLGLYSADVDSLSTEEKIARAVAAEKAALDYDPRIVNSEGGEFSSNTGARYFANSLGFAGGYRSSSVSLSAVPVAKEGANMERDYWYTLARTPEKLEAPEFVGQEAARRALRRLGARKISTRKAPVVFEPRIARGLLGDLFEAVSGDSVYRKATFLDGMLGQKIASDLVTVVDDGTLPGLFGSSPFDDEGVPTRRTVVVEKGSLTSWLLNSYTARKLGMRTTGNCSRGLTGNGSVGSNNFYLEAGTSSPEQILRGMKGALYVTELMGQGVNIVTGDYSRGAAGMWIENGELAYPVHEITIASNLKEMLKGIVAVGNDLEFRGSIAAPTLVIGEMTISGS